MPSRVIVTGGAGFIGSELVHQLASEGDDVIVVDNLINGSRQNLADLDGNVEIVEADIRDSERMRQVVAGADVVFHLACLGVRHSLHDPFENHDVNATATLHLLHAAREAGVGRFVNVSTSEVYGTAQWAPMTTDHPTVPMTVYGAGKLAGECYARAFHRTFGYETVVVRPFNSYGPRSHHEGDSGEVIPKFVLRALADRPLVVFGDGTQTRDFTFVADTARGIRLAGFSDVAVGETLNVGQGAETTINDLAQAVAAVVGASVEVVHDEPRPGDVLRLFCDPTAAGELLGFTPEVDLASGLDRLVEWYGSLGRSVEELLAAEQVHNWLATPDPVPAE